MSALATPASVSVSINDLAFVLADWSAADADPACTLTPRLTVTVSGVPETTPTPSTATVRVTLGVPWVPGVPGAPGAMVVADCVLASFGPLWTEARTPTAKRATTTPPPAAGTIQRFITYLRIGSPSLTYGALGRFPIRQAGEVDLPVMPPLSPMLAKAADELPVGDGWLYELKWNGFAASCSRTR